MNIYFSCSLTGGRQDQLLYAGLVDHLLKAGHTVPTAGLAQPAALATEAAGSPASVYARDIGWLQACQAVVAEVSTPSHGVGYEIAYALGLGKPVLGCYAAGRPVSKMLTGNSHPLLTVQAYRTLAEALALLDAFLEQWAGRPA